MRNQQTDITRGLLVVPNLSLEWLCFQLWIIHSCREVVGTYTASCLELKYFTAVMLISEWQQSTGLNNYLYFVPAVGYENKLEEMSHFLLLRWSWSIDSITLNNLFLKPLSCTFIRILNHNLINYYETNYKTMPGGRHFWTKGTKEPCRYDLIVTKVNMSQANRSL